LEKTPWFAGRDRAGRLWLAGSSPPLALALKDSTFDDLVTKRLKGTAMEVYYHQRRDEYMLRFGHGLPLSGGFCQTCGATPMRLSALDTAWVEFSSIDSSNAKELCESMESFGERIANAPEAVADKVTLRLKSNGQVVGCSQVIELIPGLSPQTRWWALETEAAGEVPPGFRSCFVLLDPNCRATRLRKRCTRPDGSYQFTDGGREPADAGAGSQCENTPFLATDFE